MGANGDPFTLYAGPCVLEDDDTNVLIARGVRDAAAEFSLPAVFKASFDKANRSRLGSPRGPGLRRGLEQLAAVREATGLPLLTDIHEPEQAQAAAGTVDVLQIPAFLCRQTSLLVAAGKTGKAVNIKKGQWMSPEAMAGAVEKVRWGGATDVMVTERGTAFGYRDLVVDMRSFSEIRRVTQARAIFDATHSVQQPGGQPDGSTGGAPEHIVSLARAAVAAGCDGLFVEVHPDPASAPSDGSNMLPLGQLRDLLATLVLVRKAVA